jgi:hypothetical protein
MTYRVALALTSQQGRRVASKQQLTSSIDPAIFVAMADG